MWPFNKKQPAKYRIERIRESRLRIVDWQNDPRLCVLAAKMLDNADLRLMLSVMRNEHPCHYVLPADAPLDARAVQQARAEGYEMFMANLERMSVCTVPAESIEAAFEPEVFAKE